MLEVNSTKSEPPAHRLPWLWLCCITLLASACIDDVELGEKLCPCVEGFVCVDGVCRMPGWEQVGAPQPAAGPTDPPFSNDVLGAEGAPAMTSGTGPMATPTPPPPLPGEDAGPAPDASPPANPEDDAGAETGTEDAGTSANDAGADAGAPAPDADAGSAPMPEEDSGTGEELQSLEQIVSTVFVADQFETALLQVLDDLREPPHTVLIPWDHALEQLPYWTKITQFEWRGHLADFARAHMHAGLIDGAPPAEPLTIEMLNGRLVEVSNDGGRIRFDGHRNIGQTPASDGYVFLLQDVLEPGWAQRSVADVLAADERFTELGQLLELPQLAETLQLLGTVDATDGVTLFAPTNAAIPDAMSSPSAACAEALAQLIDDHILLDVTSREFTPTFRFTTRGMGRLSWDADALTVGCDAEPNPTTVSLAEHEQTFAINGVVHPVGHVLCLPAACQGTTD